jgi:bifunctional DNA-binding transcriptional regulator/antitoxin component of YhaV-PrlF toxin-antitoxin module
MAPTKHFLLLSTSGANAQQQIIDMLGSTSWIEEVSTMETTTKTAELIAHLRGTTMVAKLGSVDGVMLPDTIRQAAGLAVGDMLYAEVLDEGAGEFRVRLRKIDPDQAWIWTPEWQAKLQEAYDDLAAGRSTIHYSDEAFLAALDERSKHADP